MNRNFRNKHLLCNNMFILLYYNVYISILYYILYHKINILNRRKMNYSVSGGNTTR